MTPEQAIGFLKALGAKPKYEGGPWVTCSCLLAPWLHQNGKDSNPSFGVSVAAGKTSHYNCFTCQSGSAEELLQTLEFYCAKTPGLGYKYNFPAARAYLDQEAIDVFPLPDFEGPDQDYDKEFEEWPGYFIDNYSSIIYNKNALDYVTGRGVTMEQITQHGLRYDAKRNMVVFPFWSVYGKLAGARGRCIGPDGLQHHDYTWNQVNNTALVWYNEPVLNQDEPIVIVEGQFDCLAVERCYPHVLSNLTAKPTLPKLKKLQQCSGVVLMLDNDKAGKEATEKYLEYLHKNGINVVVAELPDGIKDPDKLGTEGIAEILEYLGLPVCQK